MICKANGILDLIRHTCNDVKDPLTGKILHLALVRPILEYGSETWWESIWVSLLLLKEFKSGLSDSFFKLCPL